MGEMNLATLSI